MSEKSSHKGDQYCHYDIDITFLSGSKLLAADLGGTSDPYLIARIGSRKFQTKVIKKTLNPKWNETWRIENVAPGSALAIQLWDKDTLSKDDDLGTCTYLFLPYENLGVAETHTLTVTPPKGETKPCGTIDISLTFSKNKHQVNLSSPNRFFIHTSSFAGALKNIHDVRQSLSHPNWQTYTIELQDVDKAFQGKSQPWNKQYPAAQTIYGEGPKSSLIRTMIRNQHTALYHNSKYPAVEGYIRSAEDFLSLVHFGKRNDEYIFFTYVIVGNVLRFSETGAAFFKDFMSKHAMHSNAAESVHYSGEFHVFGDTVVLDNNSGTFGPDKADLPKVKKLFELNFPDLKVECVDFNDPRLQELKKNLASGARSSASNPFRMSPEKLPKLKLETGDRFIINNTIFVFDGFNVVPIGVDE